MKKSSVSQRFQQAFYLTPWLIFKKIFIQTFAFFEAIAEILTANKKLEEKNSESPPVSGDEQVILQQLLCHVSLRIMSKGELIFVYFFVCFCLFFCLINACLAEYATEVNAQNIESAKQEWQKK